MGLFDFLKSSKPNYSKKDVEETNNNFSKSEKISSTDSKTKFGFELDERIALIAKGGIVELKTHYKNLSDFGKYEVIIFNTLKALEIYRRKYPEENNQLTLQMYRNLFDQADTYNIKMPKDELLEFIQSRFLVYAFELDSIRKKEFNPNILYSYFYVNPLDKDPEIITSEEEQLSFLFGFTMMTKWVVENTNQI